MNGVNQGHGFLRCSQTGAKVPYLIHCGQDSTMTLAMESQWSAAKAEIISEFQGAYPNPFPDVGALTTALGEFGLADYHWSWVNKASLTASDEYQWFYLCAEEKVQGTCLIFHPKPSREDGEKIFYIDYIAAAYWNRSRPGYHRRFSNVGGLLIAFAIHYASHVLKYRPGFCLHSLPTAESYYAGIGMTPYEHDASKEGLRYFEATPACAHAVLERSHAG